MQPVQTEEIQTRLDFLGINDDERQLLKELQPFLKDILPDILDGFYTHLKSWPQLAEMFGGQAGMDRAAGMQTKHWTRISDGHFDADYVSSVRRIGERHNKLNLEPRWYIGGYALLISGFLQAVNTHFSCRSCLPWNRKKDVEYASRVSTALLKAALLDMDIAISVYLDEGKKDRGQLIKEMADRFEQKVMDIASNVSTAATEMESTAASMTSVSSQTQEKAASVTVAAEETQASVATVSEATGQIIRSLESMAHLVSESHNVTRQAVSKTDQSVATIKELSEATEKISDVVSMIQEIAEKTNLLALNATIEAARAGEAGKGFSVVASEVKTLANQTAEFTERIAKDIETVQAGVGKTVDVIEDVTKSIGEINEYADKMRESIGLQSEAAQEIANNAREAATVTGEVTRNMSEVQGLSQETDGAGKDVLSAAQEMSKLSSSLRGEIEFFLQDMRKA